MYLPALAAHPRARVVAVCGRSRARAEALAARWEVPGVFTDYREMLRAGTGIDNNNTVTDTNTGTVTNSANDTVTDNGTGADNNNTVTVTDTVTADNTVTADAIDAVVIAAANDAHYPAALAALGAGKHVLCEKPLALTVAQAEAMTQAAARAGAITMVPFTYRFMPSNQFIKQLLDDGYIGRPYHLNMRYYAGFGRAPAYHWRFDKARAGSGVIGDLGSHFLHLAEWFYGDITAVTCHASALVERPHPGGVRYAQTEDIAAFILEFATGARGVVTVSSLAHEPTPFGQRHQFEFHGSGGTLYAENDWDKTEVVRGARVDDAGAGDTPSRHPRVPLSGGGDGEGRGGGHGGGGDGLALLEIPARHYGDARRDTVHNTYRDIFRVERRMTGEWVDAIATGGDAQPDFAAGLRVQRVMDAAITSATEGRRVTVDPPRHPRVLLSGGGGDGDGSGDGDVPDTVTDAATPS